jgi:hypothetical protein
VGAKQRDGPKEKTCVPACAYVRVEWCDGASPNHLHGEGTTTRYTHTHDADAPLDRKVRPPPRVAHERRPIMIIIIQQRERKSAQRQRSSNGTTTPSSSSTHTHSVSRLIKDGCRWWSVGCTNSPQNNTKEKRNRREGMQARKKEQNKRGTQRKANTQEIVPARTTQHKHEASTHDGSTLRHAEGRGKREEGATLAGNGSVSSLPSLFPQRGTSRLLPGSQDKRSCRRRRFGLLRTLPLLFFCGWSRTKGIGVRVAVLRCFGSGPVLVSSGGPVHACLP